MKRLITILTVLIFAFGSYAQTAKVNGSKEALKQNLANDFVEFVMPSKTTTEEVNKSALYYTDYFNVEYAEDTKIAKIKLVNNDEMSRRVITRFLLSTGVRTIHFEDEDYTIMEFFSKFLN